MLPSSQVRRTDGRYPTLMAHSRYIRPHRPARDVDRGRPDGLPEASSPSHSFDASRTNSRTEFSGTTANRAPQLDISVVPSATTRASRSIATSQETGFCGEPLQGAQSGCGDRTASRSTWLPAPVAERCCPDWIGTNGDSVSPTSSSWGRLYPMEMGSTAEGVLSARLQNLLEAESVGGGSRRAGGGGPRALESRASLCATAGVCAPDQRSRVGGDRELPCAGP